MLRYTGMLFYPRGAKFNLDMRALSPIQGRTAYDLYGQLKREMENEEFDARIDAEGVFEAVHFRFRRVGETAGFAAFVRDDPGNDAPGAERLEAAMAVMARLDPAEDAATLEAVRALEGLESLEDADWDSARSGDTPVVAAFFATESALNDPLVHGLMSLAGAAFFDRLGLLG